MSGRSEVVGVVEYRKKEPQPCSKTSCHPGKAQVGMPGRARCQARALVGTPGQLQSRQVGCLDPLGGRNNCERVLEFVSEAIRDERGDPIVR